MAHPEEEQKEEEYGPVLRPTIAKRPRAGVSFINHCRFDIYTNMLFRSLAEVA